MLLLVLPLHLLISMFLHWLDRIILYVLFLSESLSLLLLSLFLRVLVVLQLHFREHGSDSTRFTCDFAGG